MKLTGDKLQAVLTAQREAVVLVRADGREYHGLSPRFAAAEIAGGAFTGYGSRGVVQKVKADDAPRRGPFATRHDIAATMAAFIGASVMGISPSWARTVPRAWHRDRFDTC
jgi:hypothetical protein